MRIVADTNILISAFLWRQRLLPIYRAIRTKKLSPCFIESTWQELEVALSYQKFAAQLEKPGLTRVEMLSLVERFSVFYPDPPVIPRIVFEDPSDDAVLAAALVAGASFIISGDEHLLKVTHFRIPIVSPKEFIETVLGG